MGHGNEVDLCERDYGSKEFDQYLLTNNFFHKQTHKEVSVILDMEKEETEKNKR